MGAGDASAWCLRCRTQRRSDERRRAEHSRQVVEQQNYPYLVSVNIVAVLGVLVYLITSQGAAPPPLWWAVRRSPSRRKKSGRKSAVEDGPADRQPAGAGGYVT